MGLCRDNVTNYLAQLGYSVVRIPREGIAPLNLIGRDRDRMQLGTLNQLITNPPGALPNVTADQAAAQVSGQASSKMKFGIGINVLGNVLGALAGTQLGIDAAYQKARTIQFEFKDVSYDSVAPLTMGQYLREAQIDSGNPVLDRYIIGKGQLYVITEILKSDSITVKAEGAAGSTAALDVPVIEKVAKGKIAIDLQNASSGIVTYTGPKQLTFGFKCFRVGIEDGEMKISAAAPNDVALAAGVGAPEYALGSSGMVEFDRAILLS